MGSGTAGGGGGGSGDLLRSLCEDSAWDYAVFWKLSHEIPMFLSWKDGYYNPRPKPLPEYTVDASGVEIRSLIEDASQHLLGLIVAEMSFSCYPVGEGLVGEVAGTGNYCWLSCDDVLVNIKSEILSGFPHEWVPQLLAGVKTILLVPVLPHGVLQLGSLEMVTEDMAVVAQIAERFVSLHNVLSHSPIYLEPQDVQDLFLLPPAFCLIDDVDDSLSVTSCLEKTYACPGDVTEERRILNFDEFSATFKPLEENLFYSMDSNHGNLFGSEEAHTFTECYSGGFDEKDADYCATSDLIALTKISNDIQGDIRGNVVRSFVDSELEEVFSSNFINGPLAWENGVCLHKDEVEYPMEADFGYSSVTLDSDNSLIKVGNPNSLTILGEALENSPRKRYISEGTSAIEREDSTAFSTRSPDGPPDSSISSSTLHCEPNLINEKDHIVEFGAAKTNNEQKKATTGCKRKGRPDDNPKLRPRDRQLIQDRVKELRELVPNGSKYSIDALLAQTVKQMLFLRSVTSRAEKLRKCAPPEESGWNRWRELEIDSRHQNGSSWALEIAGELQVCPIVVEDLEYPGLMLIEMPCNDHGLFLEIAQVLRRLELNIVKGSTKTHSCNSWASFIVEASKGFHRIDIFWPLMQLWQLTRKSSLPTSA